MLCDRVEALEEHCAKLEKSNEELEVMSVPAEGEHAVFLNKEDQERAAKLFAEGELAYEQEDDPGMEFDQVTCAMLL